MNTSLENSYEIYIQAQTGNQTKFNATSSILLPTAILTLVKQPNQAPFFEELESEILLDLNKLDKDSVVTFVFPDVLDSNILDHVWISVDKLPSFATYVNETLETSQLIFTGITEDKMGVYPIKVNVTDEYLATTEYDIQIEIDKPFIFAGVIIEEEIEIENSNLEKDVEEVEEISLNVEPLTAKIESISQRANLTIKFSEQLKPQTNLTLIKSAINLTLVPQNLPEEFDMDLISFDWKILSFSKETMVIQIFFKNPLYVSMNIIQDKMRVVFLKPYLFISKESGKSLHKSSYQLQKFIPRQLLDTKTTQNFSSAANRLDNVL